MSRQGGEAKDEGGGGPATLEWQSLQALLCLSAWPSLLGFHIQMSHCLQGLGRCNPTPGPGLKLVGPRADPGSSPGAGP